MVVGKAGRAETPTDPAPLDMIETMVDFRPREFWPRRCLRPADAERQAAAVLDALIARRPASATPADRRKLANARRDGGGRRCSTPRCARRRTSGTRSSSATSAAGWPGSRSNGCSNCSAANGALTPAPSAGGAARSIRSSPGTPPTWRWRRPRRPWPPSSATRCAGSPSSAPSSRARTSAGCTPTGLRIAAGRCVVHRCSVATEPTFDRRAVRRGPRPAPGARGGEHTARLNAELLDRGGRAVHAAGAGSDCSVKADGDRPARARRRCRSGTAVRHRHRLDAGGGGHTTTAARPPLPFLDPVPGARRRSRRS